MSRKCALAVAGLVRVITLPIMKWNRVSTLAQASERLVPRVKVRTRRGKLLFYTPSKTAIYWPRHGFAAEPQTLEWIDTIGGGDVLWDVGANVGAYALYAAKIPGISVLAFEPNPFTFHTLVKNISLNRLEDSIKAFCLAFSDVTKIDDLYLPNIDAGTVCNVFGKDSFSRGRPLDRGARIAVPGMSIDRFCEVFEPPLATHMKIDVDNIEERIVAGGIRALSHPELRSVLIEMDDERDEQKTKIYDLMTEAGLAPAEQHPSTDPRFFNQLFERR